MNAKTPRGSITASVSGATLGSIGNAAAARAIELTVNNGIELELNGSAGGAIAANNYSGLGAVTLGSTEEGAPGTTLKITAAAPVTFINIFDTMNGTTGNWATLDISDADHIFNGIIGGNSKLGNIKITSANKITFGADVTATEVNLTAGSTAFINDGINLTVDKVNGPGMLSLNTALPIIGDITPLSTLQLRNIDLSAGIGEDVKTATLDITSGTKINLNGDLVSTNVTTGITSSDNSSTGFAGGNSYAIFNEANDRKVSNLGVSVRIDSENTLTATGATPSGNNKVKIDFQQDGIFILEGKGIIDTITATNKNEGTFKSTISAGETLLFSESISGDEDHRIKEFSISGANQTATAKFTNQNLFANKVTNNALIVDATTNGLTIDTPEYIVIDTIYNIGDKTVTITGGAIKFEGDIVIKANYVDNAHVSLDLSAIPLANIDIDDLDSLTYDVTSVAMPARDTVMKMMSLAEDVVVPQNAIHVPAGSLWKVSATNPCQLIFNPTPAVVVVQNAAARAEAETGATVEDFEDGVEIMTSLGGKGLVNYSANDTKLPQGASPNQPILSIVDITNFQNDLSTSEGTKELLELITNPRGFLAACNEQIMVAPPGLYIPLEQATTYAIVAKQIGMIPPVIADAIIDSKTSGISRALAQDIVSVAANDGQAKVQEMSDRITHAASNAASNTFNQLASRSTFTNIPTFTMPASISLPSAINVSSAAGEIQNEAIGIAAGDSKDKFGIWGNVNGGTAKQKQYKGNDGFHSTSHAYIVGIDTLINDETSIGAAISHSMNYIKHKNTSKGNKTDSSSWMGSLYASHQLENNYFIRGTALFNKTHVNNKERRVITGGYGTAQAKYNLVSYGGEASVGLYHKFSQDFIATPTIGLRILHNNKVRYSETGNTTQNYKNITLKSMDNYSALAGLSIAKTILNNSIIFIPEAHANFQYGINTKTPKGSFVSPLTPSQNTNFIGSKASKLTSTYGLSLTGSNDKVECGISGDITLSSKYIGYQGGLKLKVKF